MPVLFQDEEIVVVIKPTGLDAEHDLPSRLCEQLGGEIFTVHRLDKHVGGVMVYARRKASAAALSAAIQNGTMIKEYTAVVHGVPPESGDWTDLLFKDSRKNKVFVVGRERRGVKKARLTFERLTDIDPATVFIRLYTGRSHQIRVQFASRGFPLVGDHKYGARDDETLPRLFSSRLTFPHRGKTVTFEAVPWWEKGSDIRDGVASDICPAGK